MLGLLAQGKFSLGAGDPASPANAPGGATEVRFDSAPPVFSRSQLRSFH